ncbi:MAG: phosphatidate cytidylyltransferase [Hyphomonadaceae bacterium]|nr:phosphatidate cytidylyltransferase [Hyphomonadaceae bacterium]
MSGETAKRPVIWSNLGVRVFSAVLLAAVCIPPFYFGGVAWAALIGLLGVRAIWEWVRMSDSKATMSACLIPVLGLIATTTCLLAGRGEWVLPVMLGFAAVAGFERNRRGGAKWSALGLVYILTPCLFGIYIRGAETGVDASGFRTLLHMVLVVIAADVGAYFGGSYIRGPKLLPKLSPGKTWSGFVSGLLCAMTIGVTSAVIMGFTALVGALCAAPVALFAVVGDFFESGLKRTLNVKDAGDVLPGHGGILDRMDSMIGAVTILGFVLLFVPGIWPIK